MPHATPEAVAQGQLDAYNAHDLEAFLAWYAEDVRIFRMPSAEPALCGIEALRGFYRDQRFNLPALHAEVLSRIVMGNTVVDHERVSGLGAEPSEVVVVYDIRDGRIHTAWFHRG